MRAEESGCMPMLFVAGIIGFLLFACNGHSKKTEPRGSPEAGAPAAPTSGIKRQDPNWKIVAVCSNGNYVYETDDGKYVVWDTYQDDQKNGMWRSAAADVRPTSLCMPHIEEK